MKQSSSPNSGWSVVFLPFRVLAITLVLTGLTMAVSLMVGLLVTLVGGMLQGIHPDLAMAYRNIAFPVIRVAPGVYFLLASWMEIRYYMAKRRGATRWPGGSTGSILS